MDDIAIAVTKTDDAVFAESGIYILFGRTGAWPQFVDIIGTYNVVITGLGKSASVANAGDVNGDRIDDLLIGDPVAQTAGLFLGRANWTTTQLFNADFTDGTGLNDGFIIDNSVSGNPLPSVNTQNFVVNTTLLQSSLHPLGQIFLPPTFYFPIFPIFINDQVPGLWHVSTRRGANPGHTPNESFYFGQDSTGTYDVGHTAGRITSPEIDLTAVSGAELSFNYFLDTEHARAGTQPFPDQASVLVSTDGVNFTKVLTNELGIGLNLVTDPTTGWTKATFNLKNFVGQKVRIQFRFDTIDSNNNAHEGWYVDDVVVRSFFAAGNPDIKFTGGVIGGTGFGASVAGIGDINGDTRKDFAVLFENPVTNNGQVFIVLGRLSSNPFVSGNISTVALAPITVNGNYFVGYQTSARPEIPIASRATSFHRRPK